MRQTVRANALIRRYADAECRGLESKLKKRSSMASDLRCGRECVDEDRCVSRFSGSQRLQQGSIVLENILALSCGLLLYVLDAGFGFVDRH